MLPAAFSDDRTTHCIALSFPNPFKSAISSLLASMKLFPHVLITAFKFLTRFKSWMLSFYALLFSIDSVFRSRKQLIFHQIECGLPFLFFIQCNANYQIAANGSIINIHDNHDARSIVVSTLIQSLLTKNLSQTSTRLSSPNLTEVQKVADYK